MEEPCLDHFKTQLIFCMPFWDAGTCCHSWSGWGENRCFIKPIPSTPSVPTSPPMYTPCFPSLTSYDVWLKALFPCSNDCIPRFSRARSWQSHFLCNFMVVFLNEDIGRYEAGGQSLLLHFSIVPEYVSFHLMKSNSSFTPLNSARFFSFFFSSSFLVKTFFKSLWYLVLVKEINRFNTTPGQRS